MLEDGVEALLIIDFHVFLKLFFFNFLDFPQDPVDVTLTALALAFGLIFAWDDRVWLLRGSDRTLRRLILLTLLRRANRGCFSIEWRHLSLNDTRRDRTWTRLELFLIVAQLVNVV